MYIFLSILGHVISKDDDDRLKTILGCVSKDDNKIKTMLLGRVKSEDDNKLKSFQGGFLKNLKSLYRFTRPNTLNGLVSYLLLLLFFRISTVYALMNEISVD